MKTQQSKNNQIKTIIGIISLIFLFLPLISATSSIYDSYKPYLHNPSVGNVPKLETFGVYQTAIFQGAGTYTYDLAVPPGTAGLQPSLSLGYNSQTVLQCPGITGGGWSLTENSITRNVNYTINNTNDDYFVLSLNNNRLKLFYNGSNWNAEINPRQLRIENLTNNGKMYWVVTTTDGTKYRFGYNNDSLLDSNTGRNYSVKWNLDIVQDIHNNNIFYSYKKNPYSEDKGAVYLSNITYNNDQLKLVSFNYEAQTRPDRRLVLEQGNMLDESRRLSDISIFFNNSLVRKYSLNYISLNDEKSISSISDISYVGSDGSSVLNTVRFEYYNASQGFDNTTGKWIVPEGFAFSSTDLTGKDFGVRLIDVNNDGFPDLVKSKAGTNETRLNNKINGWNATSMFNVPVDIVNSDNKDQGVRFDDVNGDGLVDILKAKGGTRAVYLNNGTGWSLNSNWSIPIDFISSSDKYLGAELVDLNGDGKADILEANESTKEAYLNNGTGWQSVPDWIVPDYFVTSDDKDTGLRLLDFNGDGLQDLIKGGTPGSAWLNNGTGWQNSLEYAPNLEFVDYSGNRPDLGVRFMDINGDGLQDILQNFYINASILNQTCFNQTNSTQNCTSYNVTFATNTKINNGSGWMPGNGWLSSEKFTDEGYNIGRRVADVNGDGYADIIVAYQASPYQGVTHIKNATNAFILKGVTNAYGGLTQLYYKQSTLGDNGNNLGFNIWLVNSTSLNNSMSEGFAADSKYSYLYQGGRFDYNSREFRGFAIVNETLPDNSIISHFFYQDAVLKGKEYQTSLYDSSGSHMTDAFNQFSYSLDNMIYLNQTSSQVYDGNLQPLVNNIIYGYDYYGNINIINNSGDAGIAGDEKLETFNYIYNSQDYILNKPSNYTLTSGNSTIVKQAFYFYDNLISGITKGDLTKVQNYNNKGTNPETGYAYDSFGNVIKETQPLGQNTTYDYDSTGTYRIKETNQLGHQINYGYNFGTRSLLYEVRDGLNKTYTYDPFGRIKTEIVSPDTMNSPTKNYTYLFDGIAPEVLKLETKSNEGNYSETLYFYDGFSNPVQLKSLLDGKQIVKNYFYDSKFRINEEQNPYFASYSVDLGIPSSAAKITYAYDPLDRVINLTKQDNSSISVIFNKSLITQFDENKNRIDYTVDPYSRIKSVTEYYNGSGVQEQYVTNYSYLADDNLIKIVDTNGNNFSFEYDSLGRKASYKDPNMNLWRYSYDLNGNLINQTDGRNITVKLQYDPLNRLTKKYSSSNNITFVYDIQYNGTLGNVTLISPYFKPIYYKYTYDNGLRITKQEMSVNMKQGPESTYREWITVSFDYDSQNRVLDTYLPSKNLSYSYNPIGKLSSISGFLTSVNYNEFGRVSNRTYSNNLITQINYDFLSRIINLQTGAIQNLSYVYDPTGNIKEINDGANLQAYKMDYDSLNRLTTASIQNTLSKVNQTMEYNYNSIGNLLSTIQNEKNILNPIGNDTVMTIINLTYGDMAHAPETEFITRSSQINVTGCGTLKYPDTIYTLQSNVSADGTCFTITAKNITLVGNGYSLTYGINQDGHGVYSTGFDNLTLKNLVVIMGNPSNLQSSGIDLEYSNNQNITGNAIYIAGFPADNTNRNNNGINLVNVQNSSVYNNSINISGGKINAGIFIKTDYSSSFKSSSYNSIRMNRINVICDICRGIYIWVPNGGSSGHHILSGNSIRTFGTSSFGIDIEDSGYDTNNNLLENNMLIGNSSYGLSLGSSSNNLIKDTDISSFTNDVKINSGNNNTFLNVTYFNESVSGQLIRKWYLEAQVNYSNGTVAYQSNVSGWTVNGTRAFSNLTDTNGRIPTQTLIEYVNNGGTKTYYTNYTVNASKGIYTASQSVNLSENKYLLLILDFQNITLPNDTNKFYIKNSSGSNVAWFGDSGNIVLKGTCTNQTTCNAPDNSFIISNSSDGTTAYIDAQGNLCIEKGDCADKSSTCNPARDAFIIRNSSDYNMSYIDSDGDLCLTGELYQNSNP